MKHFVPSSIDYTPLERLKRDLPTAIPLLVGSDFRVEGTKGEMVAMPFEFYALLDFTASYSTVAVFPKEPIADESQLIQMYQCVQAIAKALANKVIGREIYAKMPRFTHTPNHLGYNRSIYIYSPTLPIGAESVRDFFEAKELRPRVRDLDYYKREWEARRPDIFISHDSADKAVVAEPLYHALNARGLKAWLDKYSMKLGDSLTDKINEGIAECRYGLLILSPAFLANERWAQRELRSFSVKDAIEESNRLIPVWHGIGEDDLRATGNYWLIDKLGGGTKDGIEALADQIVAIIGNP